MFLKISQYSAATLLKKRLWHRGFHVNFARFLRTSFLQNTSGWLLLFYNSWWLYTLQLYLASWQLSSSNKSLVGKKNSSIYLMDFTDLDFFFFFSFIFFHFLKIFLYKCLFTLSVTQRVCCTLSKQLFYWLGDTWTQCFWPILKLTKCNLVQTFNIPFETLLCGFLLPGRQLLLESCISYCVCIFF